MLGAQIEASGIVKPVSTGSGGAPRVALVTNIPTPYRNPCYRELARLCDLRVFFNAMAEPDRDWKFTGADLDFAHEVIPSWTITRYRERPDLAGMRQAVYTQIAAGLPRSLWRFRPDVVVGAAFNPTTMLALAYARMTAAKFILWSEGTRHTEARLGRARIGQRKAMVQAAHGFWTNGVLSTELLDDYGRGRKPVQDGMTGVDTRVIRAETHASMAKRAELRASLGIDGRAFLYVGSVIELKGIRQMMRAFGDALAGEGAKATLVVAGRGPLTEEMAAAAKSLPRLKLVQLGYVTPQRLPELFAAADAFILPSLTDNWSLAALEAAVAGVPQIVSAYNGGSRDLIDNGAAGTIVDPLKHDELTAAIAGYLAAVPPRAPLDVLEAISERYGPEAFARRAIASIETVTGRVAAST